MRFFMTETSAMEELETVTKEDLKVKVSQSALPLNIIMDGKRNQNNISLAGINDKFLSECLNRAMIKNEKDVILMTLDNNGVVFIQGKNQEGYKTFTMNFSGGDKWERHG